VLIKLFSLNTIIRQQKQEQYMNQQMELLHNPLTTRPIQMGYGYPSNLT